MCKSKFQLLYTYLLIALVALVGMANHFNFVDISASDSFVMEESDAVDLEEIDAEEVELPTIARSYAGRSQQVKSSASSTTAQAVKVDLPAVSKIVRVMTGTEGDPGTGINRYHSLLYGHANRAGQAFKTLYVGDLFTAVTEVGGTRQTYRVVARKVYNVEELTDVANIAEIQTIYEYTDGITLMTCGNGQNSSSTKRLVLWAVAV